MSGTPPQHGAIIDESGEEPRMPLVGWKKSSVIFVGLWLALGFMVGGSLPGVFLVPSMVVFGIVGVIAIYATPSHLSVWKALSNGASYLQQPKYIYSAGATTTAEQRSEGGLVSYTPLQPDTRTQDLTNVEVALPGADAVETSEGMMEAMVEVRGDNMDFAPPDAWATKQGIGADYADRHVDGTVKINATTQKFQFNEIMDRLETRMERGLDDPHGEDGEDPRSKRGARALLEDYYENRPAEIEERGTQEVRYFIVVSVSRKDVLQKYGGDEAPMEKVAKLPIVGRLAGRFVSVDTGSHSDEEIRQEMIKRLNERVRSVRNDLVVQTPGYEPRRLTAAEIMILLANHFNGNPTELNDVEGAIEHPTTVGSSRRDTSESSWGEMPDSEPATLRREGETQ